MVGTNFGARQIERAHRIAWTGAALAGGMTLAIGGAAALWPLGWAGLFSSEPAVLAAASGYLRWVGPAYGFLGFGMALYFASQGAGRMGWPLVSALARLGIVTVGSWLLVRRLGVGLDGIFLMLAAGLVLMGTMISAAVWAGSWRRGRPS
jgi:Na+-driven multidrug efflux pump